jgi:diguanylate cyclase (GGDEF)-like protein
VPLRSSDDALVGAVALVHERIDAASMVLTSTDNVLHIALRMATLALADERARAGLREAAERDALTGLLNRAGLSRRASELTDQGVSTVGLVYLDLDDFKPVNDEHGHAVGDAVLVEVGQRIREAVRDHDLVCRVGGDEFAVLCAGRTDQATLTEIADRARHAIARHIVVDGATVAVGASIGLALGAPAELAGLLARADGALYQAKRAGKSRVIIAA